MQFVGFCWYLWLLDEEYEANRTGASDFQLFCSELLEFPIHYNPSSMAYIIGFYVFAPLINFVLSQIVLTWILYCCGWLDRGQLYSN